MYDFEIVLCKSGLYSKLIDVPIAGPTTTAATAASTTTATTATTTTTTTTTIVVRICS